MHGRLASELLSSPEPRLNAAGPLSVDLCGLAARPRLRENTAKSVRTAEADMNEGWSFSTAGRIFFGWGRIGALRDARSLFGKRALICSDRNIIASGIAEQTQALLEAGGCEVLLFPDGRPEVDLETIENAVEMARPFRPEVVVGLGGGSNLALGKAVALLLRPQGPLSRYYGENAVPGPAIDLIAIPTTAGTGSEVSPVTVVSDADRAMKVGVASRWLIPRWAIVDPALTLSCPPHVTAHAGMDALSHAIESFCARDPSGRPAEAIFVGKNPISDSLAKEAIVRIAGALPFAYAEPENRAAREDMALASLLAGMAFANAGNAATHALQYPVGEATHTSHGLGNAVLLPAVLRAIRASRVSELAFIARALDPSLGQVSEAEAAERAPELVATLGERVGIPRGLAAIGMPREQLPAIAELAFGVKRLLDNSPVAFDRADLLRILEEAY
jgi:alcohol dehydrogenase